MTRNLRAAIAFVSASSFPLLAHAEEVRTISPNTIVVAQPSVEDVAIATGNIFADLVRAELQKAGRWEVLGRSATPETPCGDPSCASVIAAQAGAENVLVLGLGSLADRVVVRVALVDGDGAVSFTDRVTGITVEDLDPLATRIATAASENRYIASTITTGTVTRFETRPPLRRPALMTVGAHMGPVFPMQATYAGASHLAIAGAVFRYDLERYTMLSELDAIWTPSPAGAHGVGLGGSMGARYHVSDFDIAPFLGGGLGYRGLIMSDEDADLSGGHGFNVYGTAGIGGFRAATLHVDVEARYELSLVGVSGSDSTPEQAIMISVGFSKSRH